MKRFNILYWFFFPIVLLAVYVFYTKNTGQSMVFYGFAENKETQINLDNPIIVNRIFVKSGQSVRKGDLLLEVTRTALDLKISDIEHNIAEINTQNLLRRSEIAATINRLKAQRAEKISNIKSQIQLLEAEIQINEELVKGLKSVKVPELSAKNSPIQVKIKALQEQLTMVAKPLDIEIQRLEKEQQAKQPSAVEANRLETEKGYYEKEKNRLHIYAPSDGLIGTIHCKEGENIANFTTLISFYEAHPNAVAGYIHESLVAGVNIGDSVMVESFLKPDEKIYGKVTGLGHRIVEIPERLRKVPEIKTYGREILIEIPIYNQFLQKEKVMLNILGPELTPITSR